jgi:hypothetical protein
LHFWQKRTAGKHGQNRCEYFEASFHEFNFPFSNCFGLL